MHEKRSKIDFFVNFRKLQKKLPICKKRYAEILNVARTVVTNVEKNEKRIGRNFFGSHFEEQSVVVSPMFLVVPVFVGENTTELYLVPQNGVSQCF